MRVEKPAMETISENRSENTVESTALRDVVVACVQQRLRIYATLAEYRADLQRFLRIAQHKHAQLVIFPELAGLMLAPPLLRTHRVAMLKYADLSTRRRASWRQRTMGRMAKWAVALLQLDLFHEVAHSLLLRDGWQHYCDLFGGLAREFQVTLVAPSTYLPDPADQVIRNLAGVFGENGDLLGYQTKVMLHEQDKAFAQPGADWQVIQTSIGALGMTIGNDVLLPEVGQLLAYKGAEILIAQGASRDMSLYHKLRAGILARVQETQLFAVGSFLVGHTTFNQREDASFVGKSAILAPQALTPRLNGVLVEMGNPRSEGVLSANWNLGLLKEVWAMSDSPIHKDSSLQQMNAVFANLYTRLQVQVPGTSLPTILPDREQDEAKTQLLPASETILHLDDLPISNTITRRWPLSKLDYPSLTRPEGTLRMPPLLQQPSSTSPQSSEISRLTRDSYTTSSLAEDETEEMDALPSDTNDSSSL